MTPIRTERLSKRYGANEALRELTFELPPGSIYALVGPNGAGKTTTLQTLMNILTPTSGRAEVLGTDSRRLGPAQFERIGYVSENQEQPEWMTVGALLAYLAPFYPRWDAGYAAELVRRMGLPLDRKLSAFSRGMRMKAALVSSLAYRPELLILDEPFSGIDVAVREDLIETLLEAAAEATILISSHDLGEIETFSSHVGYLNEGRLEFSEEMSALNARFREVEVTLENAPCERFVESRFDPERTPGEIRERYRQARGIEFHPMSLRAIFVALARAGRAAN